MTMAVQQSSSSPASRSLVIVSSIVVTILTGVITCSVEVYSADHQAKLMDKTTQINHFIDAAKELDPLVVRFVSETKDGKIKDSTKKEIKLNLIHQRSTLESMQSMLSDDEKKLAKRYSAALSEADQGLKNSTGPLDSRDFIQSTIHIAELRPQLYSAIRN